MDVIVRGAIQQPGRTAPLVNPLPSIWTSIVVPWSPYDGLAEETLGPEGALVWSEAPGRTSSTAGRTGLRVACTEPDRTEH